MKLIYSDEYFTSYTDDFIRSEGVIEIELITNELVILNLDDSIFEKFIFNLESYLIENGTSEIIARKFIPNEDFLSICFDSKSFTDDDEFILIFINKQLKKIEKAKYIVQYSNWLDYIKNEYINIKNDNLLDVNTNNGYKPLQKSINYTYVVKEINDNILSLVSTSTGCCNCAEKIEGIVKWKDNNNKLLVDVCVID